MTNDEIYATTPCLGISCSSDLAAAAAGLVATKDELDELGRTKAGGSIVGQIFPNWRGYRSMGPHCFAFEVLPFFKYARATMEGGERYKVMVPTSMVIGESWRWWPVNLDEVQQEKVVRASFDAFAESEISRAKSECAQYSFIKPLGIVLAHEGKNRVALFKELGLPHIPALVSDEGYPAPERIRIFELRGVNVAVLDGRLVERINALNLVRGLMEAYGIKVENRWPSEYAELTRVLGELNDSGFKRDDSMHVVDMDKLKIDGVAEASEVVATLLDLKSVKLPLLKSWLQGAGGIALLILALRLTARWPDVQVAIALVLGGLTMLLVAPVLPLLRCQVRDLKDQQRVSQFFDARRRIEIQQQTQQ